MIKGVEKTYIQFDSGEITSLIKASSESGKTGEKSNWKEESLKLPPGDHSFTIVAEDKAGNKSDSEKGEITFILMMQMKMKLIIEMS